MLFVYYECLCKYIFSQKVSREMKPKYKEHNRTNTIKVSQNQYKFMIRQSKKFSSETILTKF